MKTKIYGYLFRKIADFPTRSFLNICVYLVEMYDDDLEEAVYVSGGSEDNRIHLGHGAVTKVSWSFLMFKFSYDSLFRGVTSVLEVFPRIESLILDTATFTLHVV